MLTDLKNQEVVIVLDSWSEPVRKPQRVVIG